MSAHEINLALAWLNNTLLGDSTLAANAPGGIHRAFALDGSAEPYVIFAHQSGSDVTTMNGVRLIVESTFQVKAVGTVDYQSEVVAAATRIDDLMGGEEGLRNIAVSGGYIYAVWRQSPLWADEGPTNGQIISNVGGLYRIQISQSS